ncbi:hypothetical protein M431DRAFT_389406 [Trichoderma harzianum CBS 226.95]|uniref:Uncharacterized protein n=1 Tax=Trichoderma harzianum CBS 226.95 TaxID=983964 RepID=A0A2T4AIN0_TRIHA|nr:hypothetical protein M431DRAFT_389406 [Trichoderma harzianum CBS 226.95]PTB56935.1 hypothetical protein M431DRAFT_389406 [Trichoderma harzianum CBS 226.95]
MLLLTDLSFNSWTGECLEQAGFLVSLLFWLGDYLLLLSSAAPPPLLCVLVCVSFPFFFLFINFFPIFFLFFSYSTPSISPSFPVSPFFLLMLP